jgi:uncharacterized protein YkwD
LRLVALRAGAALGLVALAHALVLALASGAAAAPPPCPTALSPENEAALTAMINQVRTAEGIARVKKDPVLRSAGRKKSMAMARGGAFAHSESRLPWADGRPAGQNIAMAYSAGDAFQAMLDSPGHRQNLLSRSWRYTGVGAAARCDGMVFFTINLMAP